MTVFVNERPISIPAGSDVVAAVAVFDPALAERLRGGEGHVTDARGIEISGDTIVRAGAILRVVVRAHQALDADA